MQSYLNLIQDIIENGETRTDRTGVGTKSVFFRTLEHDFENGFPLLTTKKVFFKGVIGELLWFLSGSEKITWLKENNIRIWNDWANENDSVGPMYGSQWVNWNGIGVNQIDTLIHNLKTNPFSRRHVISAWNVEKLPVEKESIVNNIDNGKMALAPCHYAFQFYVNNSRELSCCFHMRSCDVILGLPFNIASYSLLTYMIAKLCEFTPKRIIATLGDAHIYNNHISDETIVNEQLSRTPRPLPKLLIRNSQETIYDFDFNSFELVDYDPYPAIKASIAV